jgi:hypothetical protein
MARTTNVRITTGATNWGTMSSSAINGDWRKFNVTILLRAFAIHRGVERGLVTAVAWGSFLLLQMHRLEQLPQSG